MDDKSLTQLLLKESYVAQEDLDRAEKLAKAQRTGVTEQLLSLGIVTKDLIGQAIAESFGVVYADINSHQPSREMVLKIPEATAKKFNVVLFEEGKKDVIVATDDPTQKKIAAELKSVFKGKKIAVSYGLPEDIAMAFIHYRKALETRFSKIIAKQRRVAPEIIEEILADAIVYRASDIHFEPEEHDVIIRFRIDGILHEAGRIQKDYYEGILNRIKVQAHLRTDEHFSAQDGAIRYGNDGKITDLRVSIAPVLDGEKVVIRLLSEYVRGFTLYDLGLSLHDQELLIKSASKPFGMIIVTGPTGSGKTTSLYGLLKTLNQPEVNIATIEDPVEYKITGVNHIQVRQQTNLTFATGLRSIVRQDPDIILVGEIRDTETAEISVNAALTGHLLLTTFHANDAATAIPRLLDMNVEPFLLSSTLELIIAQRLVRRICESCRISFTKTPKEIAKLSTEAARLLGRKPVTLYQGKGCENCNGTGFKGRTAIFEVIQTSAALKELILKRPATHEIWSLVRKQGAHSMFEDGIEKMKSGVTTLSELLRVVPPTE